MPFLSHQITFESMPISLILPWLQSLAFLDLHLIKYKHVAKRARVKHYVRNVTGHYQLDLPIIFAEMKDYISKSTHDIETLHFHLDSKCSYEQM